MDNEQLTNQQKYRVYGVVLRHLSPIQKGIQFGHALAEMQRRSGKKTMFDENNEPYSFVLLECNSHEEMENIMTAITTNVEVPLSPNGKYITKLYAYLTEFWEPDLNNLRTAICFRVNMEVYNELVYQEGSNEYDTYDEFNVIRKLRLAN